MSNDAQILDVEAVRSYLSGKLEGFDGNLSVSKFAGGQSNPTFLLKTDLKNYVLRRKPPGILLKSAHAVDREFRVQKALSGSAVPVSKMHILCEDDSVIGSAFYVMDYVEGRNFNDPSLPKLNREDRGLIFEQMNQILAALHDVDIEAVSLDDFGPPGNYFERQFTRWTKQYRASETGTLGAMDKLIGALADRMPEDDGRRCLVHGDYRMDNMIFDQQGTDCLAVLDWELSTIGHPFADLAYVIMQWQMPVGNDSRGLAGVKREELGIPSDEDFVASYCDRRGLPEISDFPFCLGFCFFRMAAILQGVKKRALDGNASNPERALKMGEQVPTFAAMGLSALNKP